MSFRILQKAIDVVGVGGQFWIFALAADGHMVYKYRDGQAWQPSQTGWESLGGKFISPPSCSARSFTYLGREAQIDVVAVGEASGRSHSYRQVLFHRLWDGSKWNPTNEWENLGPLPTASPNIGFAHPVAIAGVDGGPNLVDIVAVGGDNHAYHTYVSGSLANPGAWQPWENLGGNVARAPAVAGMEGAFNLAGQVLCVFGIDGNQHVIQKYTDGSAWRPSQTTWADLDDSEAFYSVASGGVTNIQLDVLGTTGGPQSGLFHKVYNVGGNASGWTPSQSWQLVGSDDFLLGRPVVVETGSPLNRLDVFVGQRHNYLPMYQGNWLPQWDLVGGDVGIDCVLGAAAVYSAPDTVRLHVAGIEMADNRRMLHMFSDGNGWQPNRWESIGVLAGGFLIPEYDSLNYS